MIGMSYKKSQIWVKSMDLAKKTYSVTKLFPTEEQYGLISQMRRCSVSIPSNIAEGSQRSSDKEFSNFILISRGSLAELETQILLSYEFEYISSEQRDELVKLTEEIGRMLHSFYSKLKA